MHDFFLTWGTVSLYHGQDVFLTALVTGKSGRQINQQKMRIKQMKDVWQQRCVKNTGRVAEWVNAHIIVWCLKSNFELPERCLVFRSQ